MRRRERVASRPILLVGGLVRLHAVYGPAVVHAVRATGRRGVGGVGGPLSAAEGEICSGGHRGVGARMLVVARSGARRREEPIDSMDGVLGSAEEGGHKVDGEHARGRGPLGPPRSTLVSLLPIDQVA